MDVFTRSCCPDASDEHLSEGIRASTDEKNVKKFNQQQCFKAHLAMYGLEGWKATSKMLSSNFFLWAVISWTQVLLSRFHNLESDLKTQCC